MKKLVLSVAFAACFCAPAVAGCADNSTAYGLTKKEYSEIFAKTAQIMRNAGKETASSSSTGITACKYEADDDLSFVKSTGAFVYFMSELYKSNEYPLSEDPVEFTCSYEQDKFTIAMLAFCDKEAGIVTGEIYCKEVYNGEQMPEGYINVQVNYDFETETVVSFDLSQCNWDTALPNAYWQHDIYRDGVIYTLLGTEDAERQQFKKDITEKKNAYAEKLKKVKKLNADFSKEYTSSMNYLLS